MECRRQYKAWMPRSRVSGTVQSGTEGIAVTSERLNHREHWGGTEDTGESATANLEDSHSGALSGGWTIYNIRENGDRILLGDRHGSDRHRDNVQATTSGEHFGDDIRRRHGKLEAGGDCGIGGNGDYVAAEGETSGGGAGGRRGTRGAGV